MRKIISVICSLALMISLVLPVTVQAASQSPTWTQNGNTWTYVDDQGTNLTAKILDRTLYIEGTGAVPAYDRACLGNRPWNNSAIDSIVIYNGITSIGAEAFSNLNGVRSVTMPVSAFVEDTTAFGGLAQDCFFYIQGMNISNRNIGTIPYTSLDAFVALMKAYTSYGFQLNNYYMIGLAQNSAGGTLQNVVPRDATGKDTNKDYPLIDYSSKLTVANSFGQEIGSLTINSRQQGIAALEAFSIVIGDNQYVAAYNMSMSNAKGVVKKTQVPVQYTMTVPAAYQYPGRQFTLIQLGNGVINMLTDEDTNDATVTFTTDSLSTSYALVYTDAVIAAQ